MNESSRSNIQLRALEKQTKKLKGRNNRKEFLLMTEELNLQTTKAQSSINKKYQDPDS